MPKFIGCPDVGIAGGGVRAAEILPPVYFGIGERAIELKNPPCPNIGGAWGVAVNCATLGKVLAEFIKLLSD